MLETLFERRRLIVATAALLAAAGVASWFTMSREEDPQFPLRDGIVVVRFPGADAATVERLILEPIEERLAEVEEILELEGTARAGVVVVKVELLESIYDTDSAWDEVREALAEAESDFPAGASGAFLDDQVVLQEAIVLAVTGSPDEMALRDAAELVREVLLRLRGVRKVKRIADPGEQITIAYEDATARQLGIGPGELGRLLAGRSATLPGGQVRLGTKTASLRPRTDFATLDEIAATPIVLPSGAAVAIGALGSVRYGPIEPVTERMRYRGELAVGLGVIPKRDLDRVAFGKNVRSKLEGLRADVAPLRIEEVVFQPDQVESRLADLGRSLLFAIAIVAVVLFAAMGPRLGLVVVLIVPLVTFASVAIFAGAGGVLHQISIAALVIALGMLVDNAIVVAENMQYRIDRGEPRRVASVATVRELAVPLGTATGTTLAAFVPMLISKGPTADFTRAIPTLIMLTLSISYLFAVLVTPVLGELLLRPSRRTRQAEDWQERFASRVARTAVARYGWVLAVAAALIALTAAGAGLVRQQFFPSGDRALVMVDLELPEGTHLEETSKAAAALEEALSALDNTGAITAFIGRSAPRFYYNLNQIPSSPHLAQLVVETSSLEAVDDVILRTRELARTVVPGASVVARRLEQGPPIEAPIEIRLFGDELAELIDAADTVLASLRAVPGTRDVRHNGGLGVPTVTFEIDDASAGRLGLSRRDVALALAGRTLGTRIGQFRAGDDPVPIVVRSAAGERFAAADLASIDIAVAGGEPVPLIQVARPQVVWQPAAIHHRNGLREVRVFSQLTAGVTFSEVLDALGPRLEKADLPPSVDLVYAGEAAESGRANTAIVRALPLGTILLLFFLLAEFNSFRRVAIVLATVPLAAVGVVPGLLLSGQPFGFMSVLGVFSLVGIVVNNAIVLLDRVERRRGEGADLDTALHDAVVRRMRPILLTMATTVAGLLPLAFSPTSLWPPLAWAMISGLIASTLLTLLVVPALYKLLFGFGGGDWARGRLMRRAAAASLLALVAVQPASATDEAIVMLTLGEAMERAATRPEALAAHDEARAAAASAEAASRLGVMPSVRVQGDVAARDRVFTFDTPLGSLSLGEQVSGALTVDVVQPLLDPGRMRHAPAATRARANSALATRVRTEATLRAEAAERYLAVLAIDARRRATASLVHSLESVREALETRVEAGRALRADLLKVVLDLDTAKLDARVLVRARRVAQADLARAVGHHGAVGVVEPSEAEWSEEPSAAEALFAEALERRNDLLAAIAQTDALAFDLRALRAEHRPTLAAQANWTLTEGDPFRPGSLATGSLVVRWSPFAGGSRAARRTALEARQRAARSRVEGLERAIGVEIESALARLENAHDAQAVRDRGVELAAETLRVEQIRHASGRVTTNDLLAAEAALRAQETARDLARLDVLAARIALDLARGTLDAQAATAGPGNRRYRPRSAP